MCGIYGIINEKIAPFDYSTFCTLGIANDARGGDSCGIFIDGQTEYGIGKKAKFEEFFWDSKLLLNTEKCKIALGHDRKASVGGVSLEKAHPIVIKGNNDNTEFVLIHNGTIHNYEELAKKYIPDEKVDNLSDSQVLALILYHSGFDCLEEYYGGTAFVAVDYRTKEPTVYMYRGESKLYTSSTEASMERPLYIARMNDNSLVFSSIPSYLFACCQELFSVPENQVCTVKNNQLFIYKKIDRSKRTQSKYTIVTTTNSSSSTSYSDYDRVSTDYDTNRYKRGDRFLHGYFRISEWGRIAKDDEKDTQYLKFYDVYAFNGIIMHDKKSLAFVYKAFKASGNKNIDEFTEKNEFWIRFLSFDQLYFVNGTCLKAMTPRRSDAYTGAFQMLSSYNTKHYLNGILLSRANYGNTGYNGPIKILMSPREINYKDLWKDIQQLMQ